MAPNLGREEGFFRFSEIKLFFFSDAAIHFSEPDAVLPDGGLADRKHRDPDHRRRDLGVALGHLPL